MANVTDPLVSQLCGTDPQNLMEYITRQKIYDSRYWKEECFGLSVVDVLEKSAQSLQCVGGLPCHFLSLTLKLLQLHPEHDIVRRAFIEQDTFKYTRALGCLYIRLTSRPTEIYNTLEPLLCDYRKLRIWAGTNQNRWDRTTMDQFVYDLLQTTSLSSSSNISYLGITIPRLPSRRVLQESGYIPDGPRLTSTTSKLYKTLLQCMTPDLKISDPDDITITTEQYGMAALEYLRYKATIQQCPTAMQVYEKRQQTDRTDLTIATTTMTKLLDVVDQRQNEVQQSTDRTLITSNLVVGNSSGIGTSSTPTTTATYTKKRNYKSLFKSSTAKPLMTNSSQQLSVSNTNRTADASTIIENATTDIAREEDSEEYWNAERAKLGLSKLK